MDATVCSHQILTGKWAFLSACKILGATLTATGIAVLAGGLDALKWFGIPAATVGATAFLTKPILEKIGDSFQEFLLGRPARSLLIYTNALGAVLLLFSFANCSGLSTGVGLVK